VEDASDTADGEALRRSAIALAVELLSAGYVGFVDYTSSQVFASRDPAAADAISAAFLSTSPSALQTEPIGEFPLTHAGWVKAIAIGEASGEWKFRWSGEPFTSPGAWKKRSEGCRVPADDSGSHLLH
jgi:hypothetical protein